MTMSKILGNFVFGQKKIPAGWFHSKAKVVNMSPNIPDPIWTKLYIYIYIYINVDFYNTFDEHRGISIKIAKKH